MTPPYDRDLESLAAYLERFGYYVSLERFATQGLINPWVCQLRNQRLGFFPRGEGPTALAAVQAACRHPQLRSVMGESDNNKGDA